MDTYDIQRILRKLPHRYPFLLVDRVLELEKRSHIKALKNVTMNEPYFAGHFPARPVMPGVLMLEALAQAAAILSFESIDSEPGDDTVVYFAGIDNARFKKPASTAPSQASIATRQRPLWMARSSCRPT
jgi:3-hydroxyacyl-[acyl-carrier-protein] dehydratase